MAKVRGPLLSVDAAGQVGGALCFRHHAGGVHVLPVTAPGSRTKGLKPSEAQLAQRARYRAANAAWRALSAEERAQWQARAKAGRRPQSGWNLYLAAWMAQPGEEVNNALLLDTATMLLLEDGSGVLLLEDGA